MDAERPPVTTMEDVRDELRRLGYLERGFGRFVLGGSTASPVRASFAVAFRLALAGGTLFGLTAALATAAFDRRLLTEPVDLSLLALYLVAAFGAAVFVATLAACFGAAVAARLTHRRPGPRLPRNVGLGVGLLGLTYAAFWWRSHLPGESLGAHALAVLLGLGLAFALARFGSLAAVAVIAAGALGDRLPPENLSRRHMLPFVASAGLLLGAGLLALAFTDRTAEAPDFAVVPTGLRIRILAIDGLERRLTDQIRDRGEMPALTSLLARSAYGPLVAEPERVPAIVWTTIATGRGPSAHGVRSAGARRIAGIRIPMALDTDADHFAATLARTTDLLRITEKEPPSAILRGAKAFWNVAAEKGLRIGVVNWWATWPAEVTNGYIVSDRALLKLEKGGVADREAYPPDALVPLAALAAAPAGTDRARTIDRFNLEAARLLRADAPPDIEALYLPGLDICTMQQLGDTAVGDLAGLDTRLEAVRACYRHVDAAIGSFAAGLGPTDVLVLVGDPGRLPRTAGAAEGVVALTGVAIRPGKLPPVSSRDIAPTVLHLAGLPVSAELEGKVIDEALDAVFASTHPIRRVARYGDRSQKGRAASDFDPQVMEELRSLGYLQ